MIFTFHVADTYPQIYDLIGKFSKTCCGVFSPTESNYWLLPKSLVRSVNTLLHLLSLRVMLHYLFLMTHYFKSKVPADKMFISAFSQADKKDWFKQNTLQVKKILKPVIFLELKG